MKIESGKPHITLLGIFKGQKCSWDVTDMMIWTKYQATASLQWGEHVYAKEILIQWNITVTACKKILKIHCSLAWLWGDTDWCTEKFKRLFDRIIKILEGWILIIVSDYFPSSGKTSQSGEASPWTVTLQAAVCRTHSFSGMHLVLGAGQAVLCIQGGNPVFSRSYPVNQACFFWLEK